MKEIFKTLQDKYPNTSDLILFNRMIKGKGYTKGVLSKWFTKLVDKGDYLMSEKKAVLKHTFEIGLK